MKVLLEADKQITNIWSEGKTLSCVYRLMTYLLCTNVESGYVMHNSITGEMILLSNDEKQLLSSLPCEYAPWMDELIKKHFLVKAETDDAKTVESIRSAMLILSKTNDITSYTILPTTNCNARCFYCFESGIVHENMNDETADKLVRFIIDHHGNKPVKLHWFGGEPLLGIRQIDRVCAALKENKIEFTSNITTNGYLFTEEIARYAGEKWNLDKAQITMDGTEEVYNNTKAFVNVCESPFRRVIQNIHYLSQNGILVYIRLNLGRHNADDLEEFIKYLAVEFPEKKHIRVYLKTVFENCGFEPTQYEKDERMQLRIKKIMLTDLIEELGFAQLIKAPKIRASGCIADRDDVVLITPSGKIGKCENLIMECQVGDLETGITEKDKILAYKKITTASHCKSCPIYPFCVYLKICPSQKLCTPEVAKFKQEYYSRMLNDYYYDFICKKNKDKEKK